MYWFVIRNINRSKKILSFITWVLSPSFAKTVYFNYHYLPFSAAYKLPITFHNVSFVCLKGKVFLDSENIRHNMVQFGNIGRDSWCQNKRISIDFQGGTIIFGGGNYFMAGSHIRVGPEGLLYLGRDTGSSSCLNLICKYYIHLGNYNKIGWNVTIMDTDYHPLKDIYNNEYTNIYASVTSGDMCWIGSHSCIKKGTILGNSITIGMGSIVSGIFNKNYSLIGGNPASIIAEGYTITPESFFSYPPVDGRWLNKRNKKYSHILK